MRALKLPQVAELRGSLVPEYPVYAAIQTERQEEAKVGVADAISFGPNGTPQDVVDWKSDVAPTAETIERYCAQVRAYLDMVDAQRGLIVLVTPGTVITVARDVDQRERNGKPSRGKLIASSVPPGWPCGDHE